MKNPERPDKKTFVFEVRNMNKTDRALVITELLGVLDQRLPEIKNLIHTATLQEMRILRTEFVKKNKLLTPLQVFKLYLVAYYPVAEINHWIMTGKQCIRKKKIQADRWANAAVSVSNRKSRTPSIRDINGNVVDMKFRKKFIPPWVKTQTDYELYLTDPKHYNKQWREKQQALKLKEKTK